MNRIFIRVGALLLLFVAFAASTAPAQTPEREVEAAVTRFFDAMRAADGTTIGALFHPDARLQSVSELTGGAVLEEGNVDQFVQAVGTPRTEVWDERIRDLQVRVDGGLATAWMSYAFYVDDQFSHCGVNAFQFIRTDADWQILQITDTRRREGCNRA